MHCCFSSGKMVSRTRHNANLQADYLSFLQYCQPSVLQISFEAINISVKMNNDSLFFTYFLIYHLMYTYKC